MEKEAVVIAVLWKILKGDYESHELIKQEFFGKDYLQQDVEIIVKSIFAEFRSIFRLNGVVGYVYGWIDQAVPIVVLDGFLFEIIDKFVKYQPDQNGDSGILVFYDDSIYTFEISRDYNSIAIDKYKFSQV